MNITRENNDDLTAVIKIHLEPSDYQSKVDTTLEDYRKKARIDGFRPGKVPAGLVKKLYGKAIRADEVQNVLSETLNNYLKDNQIRILGDPLPSESSPIIDWDNQEIFDFEFDIALAPEVEIKISKRDKINDYRIIMTEQQIDGQIDEYSRRFGNFEPVESASENDVVKGDLCQITQAHEHEHDHDHGQEIHAHDTMVPVKSIADPSIKEQFLRAQINDVLVFNPNDAFPNEADRAAVLKINKSQLAAVNSDFEFTVTEISRFTPAEIDQDLFDKTFGEGEVDSVEAYRNRIRENLESRFNRESRYRFHLDAREKLMSKTDIQLPEEFLKRWMLLTSKDRKLTAEQLNKEFPAFAEDLKWRMIKNNIILEQKLEATDDEIHEQALISAQSRYYQYGIYDVQPEQLFRFADALLKNEEEKTRIVDNILEKKVIDHVKTLFKLEEKEISLEEFNKLFE